MLVANIDVDTIGVGLADLSGRLIVEHYEDFDFTASDRVAVRAAGDLVQLVLRPGRRAALGDRARRSRRGRGAQRTAPGNSDARRAAGVATTQMLLERLVQPVQGADLGTQPPSRWRRWARSASLPAEQRPRHALCRSGSEISAGVVIGGRLQRGSQGIAGQIGHAYAGEAHTRVCGCGNVGCLQTVAGCEAIAGEGLARRTRRPQPPACRNPCPDGCGDGGRHRHGSAPRRPVFGRSAGTVRTPDRHRVVDAGQCTQPVDDRASAASWRRPATSASPPSARASIATRSRCSAGTSASCARAWAARPAWSAPRRWR